MGGRALAPRLRLVVLTDVDLAGGSAAMEASARAAIRAGAPALQLRDKTRSTAELLPVARRLAIRCRASDTLFFVNDRLDLALAAGAHGVHVGPGDLPVESVRSAAPPGFLVGASTDDPVEACRLVEAGASYIGCGTVWATSTKGDAGAAIGPRRLAAVARAIDPVPVVAIGGITAGRVPELGGAGVAGIAVVSAVMAAPDPAAATRELLATLPAPGGPVS